MSATDRKESRQVEWVDGQDEMRDDKNLEKKIEGAGGNKYTV